MSKKNPYFLFNSDNNELVDVFFSYKKMKEHANKNLIIRREPFNYSYKETEPEYKTTCYPNSGCILFCEADYILYKNNIENIKETYLKVKNEIKTIEKLNKSMTKRNKIFNLLNRVIIPVRNNKSEKNHRSRNKWFFGTIEKNKNEIYFCYYDEYVTNKFINIEYTDRVLRTSNYPYIFSKNPDKNYFTPLYTFSRLTLNKILAQKFLYGIKQCYMTDGWYIIKNEKTSLAYFCSLDKSFYRLIRKKGNLNLEFVCMGKYDNKKIKAILDIDTFKSKICSTLITT